MHKHPVRKFLGLLALYTFIIVGIFVLQFKTESIISRTLGSLSLTLAQTQTEDDQIKLKNQFEVEYKNIKFSASEKNPVMAKTKNGEIQALVLDNYEETANGFTILFQNNAKISFAVNGDKLSVFPSYNDTYKSYTIPYSTSKKFNTEKISSSNMMLSSKNDLLSFSAESLENDSFEISTSSAATIASISRQKSFSFDAVAQLEKSTKKDFDANAKKLCDTLINKTNESLVSSSASSLTEKIIVAYVAELSKRGKYTQAVNSIPESFKTGTKRTYISAPYFNNLVEMNKTLSTANSRMLSAVSSKSLDAFTVEDISSFLLREKFKSSVQEFMAYPASISKFAPTAVQAAAILNVYADVSAKDRKFASKLEPVLDQCVEIIQKSCSVKDKTLVISDPSVKTIIDQIKIGDALVKIGNAKSKEIWTKAGYILLNTALESKEITLQNVGDIYTILSPQNKFYPHTEILGYYGTNAVWAWTIASAISYTFEPATTANIVIDFPLNMTHYVIFNGVPSFDNKIQIQGIMFRTDPRFEAYNSSGYVYQATTQSLLIKSRHKSRFEVIRLYFTSPSNYTNVIPAIKVPKPAPAPAPQPAVEAPKPAENAEGTGTPGATSTASAETAAKPAENAANSEEQKAEEEAKKEEEASAKDSKSDKKDKKKK